MQDLSREEIRLQVLKIAHRVDRQAAENLAMAKEYEKYVLGPEEESAAKPKAKRKKEGGNIDPLS